MDAITATSEGFYFQKLFFKPTPPGPNPSSYTATHQDLRFTITTDKKTKPPTLGQNYLIRIYRLGLNPSYKPHPLASASLEAFPQGMGEIIEGFITRETASKEKTQKVKMGVGK